MSTAAEIKFPYAEAKHYADRVVQLLAPHCHRCEIAGSIRRCKAEVKDIEIVCIPKRNKLIGLFSEEDGDPVKEFCDQVNRWRKVKGEPTGKYTQRILPGNGIKLDLFIVNPDNWGFQFAIRTGSANYSAQTLGVAWVKAGYKGIDGMLTWVKADFKDVDGILIKRGAIVPVREEKDFFELIGVPFTEPENRI